MLFVKKGADGRDYVFRKTGRLSVKHPQRNKQGIKNWWFAKNGNKNKGVIYFGATQIIIPRDLIGKKFLFVLEEK